MEGPAVTLRLPSLAATGRLAARLAALVRPGDALLLDGPLGAGKTTFARAFLRALTGEAALEVPSPSFTLVQSYDLPDPRGGPVGAQAHHFDLYRLSGPAGMAELGWEEAREGIVLVEWPDRLGDALRPEGALTVALALGDPAGEERVATLSGWPGRLPAAAGPAAA